MTSTPLRTASAAQLRTWTRRRDDALRLADEAAKRAVIARHDAQAYGSDVGRLMASQRAEDEALTAAHYRAEAAKWAAKLAGEVAL